MYSVSLCLCKSLHAHSSLLSRNLIFAFNCLFSVVIFILSLIILSVSTSTNSPNASLHVVEYFLACMFDDFGFNCSHFLYNAQIKNLKTRKADFETYRAFTKPEYCPSPQSTFSNFPYLPAGLHAGRRWHTFYRISSSHFH